MGRTVNDPATGSGPVRHGGSGGQWRPRRRRPGPGPSRLFLVATLLAAAGLVGGAAGPAAAGPQPSPQPPPSVAAPSTAPTTAPPDCRVVGAGPHAAGGDWGEACYASPGIVTECWIVAVYPGEPDRSFTGRVELAVADTDDRGYVDVVRNWATTAELGGRLCGLVSDKYFPRSGADPAVQPGEDPPNALLRASMGAGVAILLLAVAAAGYLMVVAWRRGRRAGATG